MSAYTSTGSSLNADTKAGAFVEIARQLSDAELLRNAANPGVAPKNNVSILADLDGKTFDITISLPIVSSINTSGQSVSTVTDYLGPTYSSFTIGTGDAKSTDKAAAALEIAQILVAAENAVTPETERPDNIQITYDFDTLTADISATIPFTAAFDTNGATVLTALDYV
jgi:hypothetical protein